jgi:hypothetical protein
MATHQARRLALVESLLCCAVTTAVVADCTFRDCGVYYLDDPWRGISAASSSRLVVPVFNMAR